MRRAACLVALGLVLAGYPSAARADEVAARLIYDRSANASGCPTEAALRDAITARVGYTVFDRVPATRVVTVRIVRVRRELSAHVEVRDDLGTLVGSRDLSSPAADCGELISSITLAISIALDPSRMLDGAPAPVVSPPPAPVCPPPLASVPCPVCPSQQAEPVAPPPPSPPPANPAVPAFHVGAVAMVAPSPSPAFALVVGGELAWRRIAIGLDAVIDVGTETNGVSSQVTIGLVRVCLREPLGDRFVVSGCAVSGGGALRGNAGASRDVNAVVATGLRGALDLRIAEHFLLRARVDVLAWPLPVKAAVGGERVWTSLPIGGLAGLDAVVDFP